MSLIIGVDPGLTGAIAFLDYQRNKLVEVFDMPIMIDEKKKRHIDVSALGIIIDTYSKQTDFAVVEKVGSMPGQGVASTFKFGLVTGIVLGALGAYYIDTYQVRPNVWKPGLGLSRDKNESRELAMKFYPEKADLFKRKKDDGRAEAVLIAYFGLSYGIKSA